MTKEQILAKLKVDLEARGRSASTIRDYVGNVRRFQDYYGKPADEMGEAEIMEHQHYLITVKGVSHSNANSYNSALRFVYDVTLDMDLNHKKVPRLKESRRIPQIFTKEEVRKIIDSADTLIHKAMLMLAYGSGLRLSEITNLKIADIESDKMRILIRQGKGDRDRYAMLPQITLDTLREYWLAYRPVEWLFVAPRKGGKYVNGTLEDAFKSALKKSGVLKPGSIHMFRRCFATHFYEDGHDLLALKKLLGHVRIDTTAWYTQLADSRVLQLKSPIETLPEKMGCPRKENANA
jgi:site-specific recombinase XerD